MIGNTLNHRGIAERHFGGLSKKEKRKKRS